MGKKVAIEEGRRNGGSIGITRNGFERSLDEVGTRLQQFGLERWILAYCTLRTLTKEFSERVPEEGKKPCEKRVPQ